MAGQRACERFEPSDLDCTRCGACCREAYHSVTVDRDDPVIARHPELMIERDKYVELARAGSRCAALRGVGDADAPLLCAIYSERPRPCREFARHGDHCLTARRRVGLSL